MQPILQRIDWESKKSTHKAVMCAANSLDTAILSRVGKVVKVGISVWIEKCSKLGKVSNAYPVLESATLNTGYHPACHTLFCLLIPLWLTWKRNVEGLWSINAFTLSVITKGPDFYGYMQFMQTIIRIINLQHSFQEGHEHHHPIAFPNFALLVSPIHYKWS